MHRLADFSIERGRKFVLIVHWKRQGGVLSYKRGGKAVKRKPLASRIEDPRCQGLPFLLKGLYHDLLVQVGAFAQPLFHSLFHELLDTDPFEASGFRFTKGENITQQGLLLLPKIS